MVLSFRTILPEDQGFLRDVYASTRWDELAITGWSDEEKQAFLDMQFFAQQQHYQLHYDDAEFLIINLGDQSIGRLYLAKWPEEYRLIDIAILPGFRNYGIGTRILNDILAEADCLGKPVRIHVERFNPAQNLYLRLGFVPVQDIGFYCFMERPVPVAAV